MNARQVVFSPLYVKPLLTPSVQRLKFVLSAPRPPVICPTVAGRQTPLSTHQCIYERSLKGEIKAPSLDHVDTDRIGL